jgi:hypothetical protein
MAGFRVALDERTLWSALAVNREFLAGAACKAQATTMHKQMMVFTFPSPFLYGLSAVEGVPQVPELLAQSIDLTPECQC